MNYQEIHKNNLAMVFALKAHGIQKYSGLPRPIEHVEYFNQEKLPYLFHLYNVVQVVQEYDLDKELIQAAWLHDTLEDTTVNYSELVQNFGERIAELVYLVTDELGRNRKERKKKSWSKLKNQSQGLVLKLSDVIANVENAVNSKNKIIHMYQKEYPEFREYFKKYPLRCNGDPWKRLDEAFVASVEGSDVVLSDADNFAELVLYAKRKF